MKVQIGDSAYTSANVSLDRFKAWLEGLADGRLEPTRDAAKLSGIFKPDYLRSNVALLPELRPYRCRVSGRAGDRQFHNTLCWGNPRTVKYFIDTLGAKP